MDVYTMNLSNGELKNLTNDPSSDYSASGPPMGRKLLLLAIAMVIMKFMFRILMEEILKNSLRMRSLMDRLLGRRMGSKSCLLELLIAITRFTK